LGPELILVPVDFAGRPRRDNQRKTGIAAGMAALKAINIRLMGIDAPGRGGPGGTPPGLANWTHGKMQLLCPFIGSERV
jgi:hypothetical protein